MSGTTVLGLDFDTKSSDDHHPMDDITGNSMPNQSPPVLPTPTAIPITKATVDDPTKTEVKP